MSQDISYLAILSLLVLVIPVFYFNTKMKLRVNIKIFYAIVRMFIQLSLVGVFLKYLFEYNNVFINVLYILLMMLIASFSSFRKSIFKNKKFIWIIFISFTIPNLIIIIYFNYFVVRLNNIFEAQYLIPIAGMIIGNTLSGSIITLNNFYNTIKNNEKEYLYSLSLGASKREALLPYYKIALLSGINPTIASIETIGLVSLPGMMTGQILGGANPIIAIKYQIAIMIAILLARYFNGVLVLLFTSFKAFDNYDTLNI